MKNPWLKKRVEGQEYYQQERAGSMVGYQSGHLVLQTQAVHKRLGFKS